MSLLNSVENALACFQVKMHRDKIKTQFDYLKFLGCISENFVFKAVKIEFSWNF